MRSIAQLCPVLLFTLVWCSPLASAAGEASKDPAGKLVADSNWQGVYEHKGHANPNAGAARLKVTQRDGKTLKAEFWVNHKGRKRGVKVNGEVDPKTGTLRMKPYEIISGTWAGADVLEEVWEGTVKDASLTFEHQNKHGTWATTLTLKTSDAKDDKGKGNKKD